MHVQSAESLTQSAESLMQSAESLMQSAESLVEREGAVEGKSEDLGGRGVCKKRNAKCRV